MPIFARAGRWPLLCLLGIPLLSIAGSNDAGRMRLENYLAGLDTLQADFTQEVVNRDRQLVESASGRVALRKPGRFRWDYQTPFERVIVADGERVWLYEADLDQVTIRRLDAGLGETPAALLTGDAEILERFEYLGSTREDRLLWVLLGPRSEDADFASIRLAFDDMELVQLQLLDRLGQTTELRFSAVERGIPLADEVFSFEVPDGVDVIAENEL